MNDDRPTREGPDPVTGGGTGTAGNPPAWWVYRGDGGKLAARDLDEVLMGPPPWRRFDGEPLQPRPPEDEAEVTRRIGPAGQGSGTGRPVNVDEADMVNAALYLRRPLLITGRPGSGKSALAYRITRELRLGRVLRWPVTTRTTLRSGLYDYDAIARAQDAATYRAAAEAGAESADDRIVDKARVGDYVQLGPLGTALLPHRLPRVLLIDELDKSDIDLPNDLLNVFEEGEYTIPELVRSAPREPEATVLTDDPGVTARIRDGRVRCRAFPLIIITSNGEREFPPALLRRCLRLEMPVPDEEELAAMVAARFGLEAGGRGDELVRLFVARSAREGGLPADQLLNSVYLATSDRFTPDGDWERLLASLWRNFDAARPG
ncbi:AAA family ATPase [Streptomyces sp. CMB-StM0423]|uniref:AAA family ATPase n=1 Tax=Streptomyces sp. CMB-StM0423 TaxID=2059884 RepID=UPI000C71303C|nr:MoxR family ATPase [Streptomyces sp. CMB-StM0423]AUH40010.1 AAA family ATPase [Streptomyces sp. CMB-StM0423]